MMFLRSLNDRHIAKSPSEAKGFFKTKRLAQVRILTEKKMPLLFIKFGEKVEG